MSDEWAWLGQVDPNTIERERFNVNARTVKRREGTQLGELLRDEPQPDIRVIKAAARERGRDDARVELHARIRTLETTLKRERRAQAKADAWRNKITTWGHRHGGPSSLEQRA